MSFIAVTGDTLFLSLILMFGIIVTLIFGIRIYIQYQKNKIHTKAQNLSERNKYALVNTFKMSRTLFNIGLVTALSMTILAFSWTTYDYEKPTVILEPGEIDDLKVIRTIQNPPPPPPPPPPVIIPEVVEPDETPDDIEFVDPEIVEPELPVAPPKPKVEKVIPSPPKPLPEVEPEVETIHVVVEEMPRFPGCEDIQDKVDRKTCAQQNMLNYIYKEINYPTIARETGIEGTVVVRFYIDEQGNVKEPEILKEIGGGCGKEAMRVVKKMNELSDRWKPGRQRGSAVKVYFNLPVKYKLKKIDETAFQPT